MFHKGIIGDNAARTSLREILLINNLNHTGLIIIIAVSARHIQKSALFCNGPRCPSHYVHSYLDKLTSDVIARERVKRRHWSFGKLVKLGA